MVLISDLVNVLDSYLDKTSVATIYQAYLFGAEAHDGQKRKTGEPYIYHPIAVAHILAGIRCDAHTITAAILHDVIEDTSIAKEQIAQKFGKEVAHMVDGVSKLAHMHDKSTKQIQADNFRKMMLAMSSDMRVIVIKIADRLHNMRTLYGMPAAKRRRISRETLDVYIPLADRLGMYDIKHELEELVLQNLHPIRYRVLEQAMRKLRGKMVKKNEEIRQLISDKMVEISVQAELQYREKTLFSIYQKMRRRKMRFSEVDDIYALRIIAETMDDCYRILGVVHNLYRPVLGKFKDYIAIPKVNGYQSLHTVLFVREHSKIEVQIRTREMDVMAESGLAAHWEYKAHDEQSGESYLDETTRKWMQHVSELQHTARDSEEFLESIKIDLFANRVFVFSPKGKIFELPRGATVLDFAYAVHTEVGNRCASATINNKAVYIGTELQNGQTVEVFTDDAVHPLPSWLEIVATGRASASIKSSLRKLSDEDTVRLGEKMLGSSLEKQELSIEEVTQAQWKVLCKQLNVVSLNELYLDLGRGKRLADAVTETLLQQQDKPHNLRTRWEHLLQRVPFVKPKKSALAISGAEGVAVNYARCCLPLPGDKIIGYVNTGRGIVVHERHCNNLRQYQKYSENIIPLQWEPDISTDFETELVMRLEDKPGVLAVIANEISKQGANINEVETLDKGDQTVMNMVISVKNRKHLASILRALRNLLVVKSVSRFKNRGKKVFKGDKHG